MEIWKPIPSLPEYEASSLGRVRCVPFQMKMPNGGFTTRGGKPTFGGWRKDSNRYCITFRGKNYKIARLVCEAFSGPCPEGYVCMHLDEDSRNNRANNLAWGTQKENLNAPGFVNHCRTSKRAWNGKVLSRESVAQIRARTEESRASLAREYGVSPSQISNIIAGRARPNG